MVDALCADRTEDRGAFTLVSKSRGMKRSPFHQIYPLDSGICWIIAAEQGRDGSACARRVIHREGVCFPHPLKLLPFYVDPAGRQLLPFYADNRAQLLPIFASGAPRRAPHTRTGMPIALAVSHTRACTPAHTAWAPPAQHAWHSMALRDPSRAHPLAHPLGGDRARVPRGGHMADE